MEQIKIIFFDVDGTLLDPGTGRISDKTVWTMNRLKENGIKICVSTGRPPASLPDLSGMDFDALVTCNGSLCYTPEETIYSDPIAPESVRRLIDNAAALGRPVSIAVREQLAANGVEPDLAEYYVMAGLVLEEAEDFEEVCRRDVYQVMVGCRLEDHDALIHGASGVRLERSWDRAIDIVSADAGKGKGVTKVLEYYGIEKAHALAFGDSFNDLQMMRSVGTGVAMGNAKMELKAVADAVCGSVAEDGIYHYCIQNGLI